MRFLPGVFVIPTCVLLPLVTSGCGASQDATWIGVRDGAADWTPGDGALPSADVPPPATGPSPEPSAPASIDPSGVPDAQASYSAAVAALCASLGEDRLEQNLRALNRLGLEMSSVRVEGSLGNPVTDVFGERHAILTIEKVWVGPTFLEGAQTLVGLSSGELAELKLPGSYIVGFGTTVDGIHSNPYPVQTIDAPMSVWDKEVIIPSAERDHFADLLSYGIEGEPLVAIVQVVPDGVYTGGLRVVETLAGNLPRSISMPWWSYDAGFSAPRPGEQRYLATFRSVDLHEGTGKYMGELLDFRPYDATVREMAQRALAAPRTPRDLAALRREADEYRLAWAVHRSSFVAATRIVGAAGESCAGDCGTYFAHDVVEDLRGGSAARVVVEGDDYLFDSFSNQYTDERCGDTAVMAVSGIDAAGPTEPASSFGCGEPSDWPSVDRVVVPQVNARLADSEATRAQVRRWLRSPEPRHLLRREADRRAPFALGPDAIWSQPMPVDQALVTAPLTLINVVGLSESTGRLVVEASLWSSPPENATGQRVELDAECNDQLAAHPGKWLVPLVMDDPVRAGYEITETDAFIIPGVVLPNFRYVVRTVDKLRAATDADAVRHSL